MITITKRFALAGALALALALPVLPVNAIGSRAYAEDASSATSAPKVELSIKEKDFGDVMEGDPANIVFTIFNKGTAPLKIDSVKPSCGCTIATGWANEVAPGQSTDVKIDYNTKNRPGAFTKTITVVSNDPVSPNLLFTIRGNVKQEISMEPRYFSVDSTFRDEEKPSELTLHTDMLDKLEITKVETGNEYVNAKVIDVPGDPKTKKVQVTVAKNAPLGSLRAQLEIYTNSKRNEKMPVGFNTIVYGDIEAPRTLPSMTLTNGEVIERTVTVKDRKAKGDLKITKVNDVGGHLEVSVKPVKEGVEYQLVAKSKTTYEKTGHYAGSIEIETNRVGEEKLNVAYSIFIQASPAQSAAGTGSK